MANAYDAGAANLPFATFRTHPGSLTEVNRHYRTITCPFTGEVLTAVPALRPDVTIVHAQKADREGNVLVEGIIGVQKEAVLAARRGVVTVEEIVDTFEGTPVNACILPRWALSAVAVVPGGAFPSYAFGYYARDNAFYKAWDDISRSRDAFLAWIDNQRQAGGARGLRRARPARRMTPRRTPATRSSSSRPHAPWATTTSVSWGSGSRPPPAIWRG